ncbi:unnamed protein product [Zymoseptoria tritici ST99CH_1A5]|uniref:Uncharacterized protein n=4 Tax=Zymoseptoria tritici TaxID=1047171 RepID=F9XCY6_ZYMTI|nr:uncharacterized protein MYCGRDRAFT_72923 [Zymoseptoria tritici IPO323]SMQ51573.1 unnamed protein product [Zymoseptoria tritici ST99CH_3D7]SMR53688.1 unnamed protein product [Zymoseptoria tritici ST99CH_1E4]SMR56034.1 unnamed protein product [Zymoseptoria tritici ST99CH_3D1]SMY25214.1 unnamed protein product [Zymoseptoria tritici ST99CH_1A5]EGP86394.1 hypothetical protein MYCGRDRAFT_72923 [Zymoseptoria tritici IPO323]
MAKLGNLIPLLILFVVIGIAAWIGYGFYTWSNELAARGQKKMEKKNMAFTKEGGLRVGVKGESDENVGDKTQNVLYNVWNNAELPASKSRLGWNSSQEGAAKKGGAAAKTSK